MLETLKKYFEGRKDVAFAFLFGSAVRGRIRKEGDIDIGIYFWPEENLEWEAFDRRYEGEVRIALDIERMLKKEVDLLVLNRAKAIIADEVIRKGIPIIVKDKGLLWRFMCIVTDEAEYVRESIIYYYRELKIATGR